MTDFNACLSWDPIRLPDGSVKRTVRRFLLEDVRIVYANTDGSVSLRAFKYQRAHLFLVFAQDVVPLAVQSVSLLMDVCCDDFAWVDVTTVDYKPESIGTLPEFWSSFETFQAHAKAEGSWVD